MPKTAVMMLAFGGPETPEEVRPFIERVTAGRNVPAARLDAVVEQYKQIGGKSPFNELTNRQARALQVLLSEKQETMPVHVGLLYAQPSIETALLDATKSGAEKVVAIVMATYRTEASYERYTRAFHDARLQVQDQLHLMPEVQFVGQWHLHPLFIEAMADRVIDTLNQLHSFELDTTRVIFSAHSVPQQMSDKSGYDEQIQASASSVASRVRGRTGRNLPWAVAYQSRSGSPKEPWLEPDLQHELAVSKKLGKTHVVVVPLGFLCDHVEVLFDLDVQAAQSASELGMSMMRAPTVGDHPTFIRLLAELAADRAESFYAKPER